MRRAVVDTNLFVSATLLERGQPFRLMTAWLDGAFSLATSAWQRREFKRGLRKPKLQRTYRVSRRGRELLLRRLDLLAEFIAPPLRLALPVRDANDEPILAIALLGEVDYLVTGDADLLVLAGDERLGSSRIVSAREFLSDLEIDR